ncbi:MAG TPA: branched-chain amino acid ABC transporter permease [Microbacteriaceae bacterium]|nr:branched-chain amino acid ABC transporter permease [Microbacteriaceae bacterium]
MLNQHSTFALARRRRLGTALIAIAGVLFALWATLSAAPPAHAAEGDPYRVSGNVRLDGEPLPDIVITVDGPGGAQTVETDADGKWSVAVPEKNADYVVALDESTLPEGIAVVDETGADETPNVKEVTVGPGGRVSVNFFIGAGERHTTSFFDQLVERLINGLNFGLMLALASIGLSLVYGTTGISNFAHAEMVTFGALMAYLFAVVIPWPLWVAIPIAVAASAAFGYLLDTGLWRPLRRKGLGLVQLMIVSIGLSLVLRYVFQMFIGGGTIQLPGSVPESLNLFGTVRLTIVDIISMATSVVVIIAFAIWLQRSRIGKATRAVSDNASLAAASGIDVDRVVRFVWILAGALAGLGGVLWAYFRPGIKWDMGSGILLLMFAAVILGGLGTAYGALVGSLIVGVLVEVSSLWIPADLKYVAALVILILILLFRPQGILGRRERIG